ncbi:MAG: peptidase M61 [Flavobacteriaceae bacterium]|nr:peptidase M61 [Flavobacteriaceae bacterium]RZW53629.1 MAG: peptidase M61 [Flavobacteriaceae bacterium]
MKKLTVLLSITFLIFSCGTKSSINDLATNNPIKTAIDLTLVVDDKVPVTVDPGRFTVETVTYRLPKVVQGTYSVSDFGSFVDDFKAYDYNGNELTVSKLDDNSWTISSATNLDKISYYVNDTYDIEGGSQPTPFSPSGTNIDNDVYVLNLHGFIGYFDSLKNGQYSLDVTAPASFKKTSAIQETNTLLTNDNKMITSYFAPRYFDITDNPMMYGNLDVEEFKVGDITIVLSVYSPNKIHSAASLKETMFTMMQAQKAYLGDIDSTPRYDIYLYLADMTNASSPKGFGALEHHTSTVVVLPEQSSKEELDASMIDVVAHEFFHIVTPLNVHSEDVHYFDYNAPTFSKHLWMYEGVTEYFAQHFQIYEGLIEEDAFYNTILSKINTSKQMNDSMSFTQMSENVLEQPYASNYYNVYMKGALIGMCMDILLREESNGNRSMLSLMKELSLKYGKNKPFEDDNIISEITAMTYPSIGDFLKTHVEGETPIDYELFFNKVGLILEEGLVETTYIQNDGTLILSGNPADGTIFFTELVKDNSFWNDNGAQPNDVIKEVDGTVVTLQNANQVFTAVFGWEPGRDIEVKLDRKGEEILIKTKTTQSYTMGKKLIVSPNATSKQNALRKAWLKG